MKLNSELSGLCMNCLQAPMCSFRKNHQRPILFCEEFSYKRGIINNVSYDVSNEEIKKGEGLCMNCQNQNECSPEKTMSGINYCNEYCLAEKDHE